MKATGIVRCIDDIDMVRGDDGGGKKIRNGIFVLILCILQLNFETYIVRFWNDSRNSENLF